MNHFEILPRTIAIEPTHVADLLAGAMAQFAVMVPDGKSSLPCIAAHWDDEQHTRIRAASLVNGSVSPVPVGDGRICFTALWQSDLAAAFDAGQIAGAEEIDPTTITPPSDETEP